MKKWLFILGIFICIGLTSCCKCMNCAGSSQWTGTGSDDICKEEYEADPTTQGITWSQFSDYMLQNGCKCIE